jgi:F-type H+-transporting ATPase subunit b
MQELLSQLGIDWHLLISQAVNFFLLLLVLWYFVYKPLLKLLSDRRNRIEEGLTKADEADRRLLEVDELSKQKLHEADNKAIAMLRKTETDAKALEARLLDEAHQKEAAAIRNMDDVLRAKETEAQRLIEKEAAAFVRAALVATVELSPDKIDDALIAKAVQSAKKTA